MYNEDEDFDQLLKAKFQVKLYIAEHCEVTPAEDNERILVCLLGSRRNSWKCSAGDISHDQKRAWNPNEADGSPFRVH